MPRRFRLFALLLGLGMHLVAPSVVVAAPGTELEQKARAPAPGTKLKQAARAPRTTRGPARAAKLEHGFQPSSEQRRSQTTAVAVRQPSKGKPSKRGIPRHRRRWQRSDASFPSDYERTPAYRYAQLEPEACYAELRQRDLPTRLDQERWPGLLAPVRLTGPLNGVTFRTDRASEQRSTTPYELFDCRLLLALHDFTQILRDEGIREVVLSSAYRPPPKSFEADAQGKRHAGGLAIDLHRFAHDDGRWIKVDRDFHGRIGATVCGKSAVPPYPASEDARLLRRLVCTAAERRLFQSILTPNYDLPHRNHLHLEITLGVRWFIVS